MKKFLRKAVWVSHFLTIAGCASPPPSFDNDRRADAGEPSSENDSEGPNSTSIDEGQTDAHLVPTDDEHSDEAESTDGLVDSEVSSTDAEGGEAGEEDAPPEGTGAPAGTSDAPAPEQPDDAVDLAVDDTDSAASDMTTDNTAMDDIAMGTDTTPQDEPSAPPVVCVLGEAVFGDGCVLAP